MRNPSLTIVRRRYKPRGPPVRPCLERGARAGVRKLHARSPLPQDTPAPLKLACLANESLIVVLLLCVHGMTREAYGRQCSVRFKFDSTAHDGLP